MKLAVFNNSKEYKCLLAAGYRYLLP